LSADPPPNDFDELVRRTAGAQPWRKLFHATNAVLVAVGLEGLDLPRATAGALLAGVFGILALADLARLGNERLNRLFFRTFTPLASPREAKRVASSTWYAFGILLVVLFFSERVAISAILVLGLADPVASYVGRRWGAAPFMGGTVLGTVTFFGIAAVVLAFRHPPPVALMTAGVVTIAERRSWPLDDNLAIPVVCAALLATLERVW